MPFPMLPPRWCTLLAAPLLLGAGAVVAQAPVVVADAYSVNANGALSVAAANGLLANDAGFSPSTHRLASWDSRGRYGGIVAVAADGSFSYDPPPGFRGRDRFTYSVRNAFGAQRAMVDIDVTGDVVWFVDDTAAAGGDGTFGSPFNSLAPVNGSLGLGDVDASSDIVFLYAGNYQVEFDLEPGQRLIGQALGLDLTGTQNDIAAGAAPVLSNTGSFPIIEIFGSGGQIRGLTVSNTNSWAIRSSTGANGGFTIADVEVASSATATGGIELLNTTGTLSLTNVSINGALPASNPALQILGNAGTISLANVDIGAGAGFTGGYVLNVNSNSGIITFDAASSLQSTATRGLTIQSQSAGGSVTLPSINVAGGATGEPLIRLQANSATSTANFAQGVVANATAVDTAAFLSDGGRLTVGGTASALSAADGPALYLESVELTADATFASLSSAGSNARGISIDSPVGTNDVIVSGTTTISSPTTEGIRVSSAAASGFLLQMARLAGSGGTTGIEATNAAVAVLDGLGSLSTSAGPAVVCTTATTNLALTTLTAAGGSHALDFDGCSGTVSATTGSLASSAGAGNHVVNVVNTSGNNGVVLTYGGTISKTAAGAAVNILGLAGAGSVSLGGTVTASNASSGILITSTTRPVTFATLTLGSSGARFASAPISLAGNTGAIDLGVLSSYTSGVPALAINYANASPGLVTTDAGSLLDTSGASAALTVDHATSQALALSFASISAPGAGSHGVDVNRGTGTLAVSGTSTFGAKTTAGVEVTNSNNLTVSFQELDITGAADGVRLANNTAGSFTIAGDGNFVNTHTNGAGGSFQNLTDNAFDLENIVNFRATDVVINGTGSHGLTGRGITGTTVFSNVDFSNIGNADNEHVFNLREGETSGAQISGSLEVNNSVIENFTDNGVYLENFAGTLDFRWTNNVLRNNITSTACGGSNCGGNGILLRADGTSRINALIQNAVFEDIDGIGLTANPEGNSGARMDIAVLSSAFTAEPFAGPGNTNNGETAISLRNAQGNSTLNFRLFSNDIRNYSGELALGVVEVESGDFTSTNGVIDVLNVHHAHEGNALQIFADGQNSANMAATTSFSTAISMNAVNVPMGAPIFGASIQLQNNGAISGSAANANYTVTNSTLSANAIGSGRRTLTMNARDFNNVCSAITNNTIAAGTDGTQPSVNLSYNGSGIVRLQGMVGSGDANAISYLGASNTLSVAAISGPNNTITSATCTTPTLPAAFPFL